MISLSIFRYLKKSIRAFDAMFQPFDSQIKSNIKDVEQRNRNLYGFDAMDDVPFINGLADRYNKWLYSDDEEE